MSGDVPHMNKLLDELVTRRVPTAYPAGIKDGDRGFERYSLKSSDYPNLIISTAIYDDDRNAIMPGYYGLILSDDRNFLVLVQSEKVIASIPVFKIEEDRTKIEQIPHDKKTLRKMEKEKKKKEKKRRQGIKKGEIPETEEIYSNAKIEYDDNGGYYLVEYERGQIKAWGAIKK